MDRLYIGTNANAFFFPVGIHGYWDGVISILLVRGLVGSTPYTVGSAGLYAFDRWISCAQSVRSSISNQSGHSSTRAGHICRLVQKPGSLPSTKKRQAHIIIDKDDQGTFYASDQELGKCCLTSPSHT
jgi:hypothetical protein